MNTDKQDATVLSDEEAAQFMQAREQHLNERAQLFVAKHRVTGLYSRGIRSFLDGNKDWMRATNPSDKVVIRELELAQERAPRWTGDMNDAEVWGHYSIEEYSKYLSDVVFVPVQLSAVPI